MPMIGSRKIENLVQIITNEIYLHLLFRLLVLRLNHLVNLCLNADSFTKKQLYLGI